MEVTAGTDDYTEVTTTFTIPAGDTSVDVTVPTTDDTIDEDDEEFTVDATVTSGNTDNTDLTGTVTIEDNDTLAVDSITPDEQEEGSVLTHIVTFNGSASTDKTFSLVISNDTTEDNDYSQTYVFSNGVTYDADTQILTIPAGVSTFTIEVTSVDDIYPEDDEVYDVTLGGIEAEGTITNDDEGTCDSETDCDGDGVDNDTEEAGGTDPLDTCDYDEADQDIDNVGATWNAADCDGDGVTNEIEITPSDSTNSSTDPLEACDYNDDDQDLTLVSGDWIDEDCDGDGVTNYDELNPSETDDSATDPNNNCDYNVADQDIDNVDPDWDAADCDGDGVTNGQEIVDGTDPLDDCNFLTDSIDTVVTSTSDCDGDGVTNENEYLDNTDPQDGCDFVTASITEPVTRTFNCILSEDPLKVYNTITPNGDNMNDYMVIYGIEETASNNITIYNRWGVQVFESDDYETNPFYGVSNGRTTINEDENLPSGTYYYVLKYVLDGERKTQVGYLYIN